MSQEKVRMSVTVSKDIREKIRVAAAKVALSSSKWIEEMIKKKVVENG